MASAAFSAFLKRGLLGLLLLALLIPALQAKFRWFSEQELDGSFSQASRPEFVFDSLATNAYQPQLEKYLEDRIGFRNALIRLRNQLTYSVFNETKNENLVVGQQKILFEVSPIEGYLGHNYVGEEEVRNNVREFKMLQDTLAKRGILLLFVTAPGKASFYAEALPARYQQEVRKQNNYEAYMREMKGEGVNVLDMGTLFRQWKDTARYPLFPRGGIHWSGYGITRAADTLFRYIEQRGHLRLPRFRTTRTSLSDTVRGTDGDIANALNLWRKAEPFRMAYPEVAFDAPAPGQPKPTALVVGDSFVWSLLSFYPYLPSLFSDKSRFWYYNREVHAIGPGPVPEGREVAAIPRDSVRKQVAASNVVMIMFTEHNLVHFDQDFVSRTLPLFRRFTPAQLKAIEKTEREILANPEWKAQIEEQARGQHRSFADMVYYNAVYQVDRQP